MIRQLQAAQQPGAHAAAPAPAAKPPPTPTETQPPEVADSSTQVQSADPGEDSSASDQAKEALAKQEAKGPRTQADILADLQKSMDDPSSTVYDPDFPGAWYLPGTTAAMKIGGYVNLSFVNRRFTGKSARSSKAISALSTGFLQALSHHLPSERSACYREPYCRWPEGYVCFASATADLYWYEASGVGKHEFKIKKLMDRL